LPETKPEKAQIFEAGLRALDGHLVDSKFIVSDKFTLADLSILGDKII